MRVKRRAAVVRGTPRQRMKDKLDERTSVVARRKDDVLQLLRDEGSMTRHEIADRLGWPWLVQSPGTLDPLRLLYDEGKVDKVRIARDGPGAEILYVPDPPLEDLLRRDT
jgi:hypothetical protein